MRIREAVEAARVKAVAVGKGWIVRLLQDSPGQALWDAREAVRCGGRWAVIYETGGEVAVDVMVDPVEVQS